MGKVLNMCGSLVLPAILSLGHAYGQGVGLEAGNLLARSVSRGSWVKSQSGVRSDPTGIWLDRNISVQLEERLHLFISRATSSGRKFGNYQMERTDESLFNFGLLAQFGRDQLNLEIGSDLTQQDVRQFSGGGVLDRRLHRTYSLQAGWKREWRDGLDLFVRLGVARCMQKMGGESALVPLGGISLIQKLPWMEVGLSLDQDVLGGGASTGIYGSQVFRKISVAGNFPLYPFLTVLFDCSLSQADATFAEVGVLEEAPLLIASTSLEVQLGSSLKGNLGYTHRDFLGSVEEAHGASGHIFSAALTYYID